jgi:enoyl-CoA hydratase/carnithine racemase
VLRDWHRPRLQRRLRSHRSRTAPQRDRATSAGSAFGGGRPVGRPWRRDDLPPNGGAYGGSTDLALACDFRIGADTAEMFMPAARLGLHYYKSVSPLRVAARRRQCKMLFHRKNHRAGNAADRTPTAMVPPNHRRESTATIAGKRAAGDAGMKRAINEFPRQIDEEAPISATAKACAAPIMKASRLLGKASARF